MSLEVAFSRNKEFICSTLIILTTDTRTRWAKWYHFWLSLQAKIVSRTRSYHPQ